MSTFEWVGYQFSWYAVPVFVTATLAFMMGLMVFIRERGSLESRLFFMMTLPVCVWLYAFSMMYCSRNEALALTWAKIAYLGVPFIATGIYHFTVVVLRLKGLWRRLAWWS